MNRLLFFLACFFCLVNCFSQNRSNIWYFGELAGINFNTNPPSPLNNSVMTQQEGCATMCNTNGQLLFYTNGIEVWNRNHQVMLNGNGLLGGQSATQSALIIPQPLSNNIYYVFTVPQATATEPLRYSIVDMTLDAGLGAVTATKNVILHGPVMEKLTGAFQANGTDYWITVKEFGSNAFYTYAVTSTGLNTIPVISNTGLTSNNILDVGYMRISPNGSKAAVTYGDADVTQLFDFDNNTGILSNPITLALNYPYGVEFSPDNSKLYVMQSANCTLNQYDLLAGSATAIQNSKVQISTGTTTWGGALALGPDKKIYVDRYEANNVAYIDQPNLAGTACNFIAPGIQLIPGTLSRIGLPNNIYSPLVINICPPGINFGNNAMICHNQTYQLPWGPIVNVSGLYADTIRNVANTCDSIINTVNLSVFPVSFLSMDAHICPNQTYQLPSGIIVSAEGIYSDTLTNVAGCDSIINTVNLFIDDVSLQNSDAHICPGQTYQLPSGAIVSVEGVYTDTLRSQASCDSIINTIHLFIDQVSLQNIDAHICPGQTYQLPSGAIVSAEGIYIDTLRSQASCDSIVNTIQLWIDDVSLQNTQAQLCSNQYYQLPSGTMVNSSGTYIDTLKSQAHCDSIINTIHLVVNDLSFTNQVDSIFAGQNYTLPSGVVVSAPGTYQSVLTNSLGCDSIITTTLTLRKTIAECITLKNAITPNGDGVNDYWVLYRYLCFKKLEVSVYNRYGSLVYQSDDYKNDWNGKYRNKELPDGTYYYVIKVFAYDGKVHVFKDNITILR